MDQLPPTDTVAVSAGGSSDSAVEDALAADEEAAESCCAALALIASSLDDLGLVAPPLKVLGIVQSSEDLFS
jgi:hypothetical protein